MGRGLGDRQRQILDQLKEADGWVPLHELADDPDDSNEMAKARSAVRGLERRDLVETMRDTDPDRLVSTTTIEAVATPALTTVYMPQANARAWYGLHVRLVDPHERAKMRQWASGAAAQVQGLRIRS